MYQCALCLTREKENRESVLKHFKPYIYSAHEMETASEADNGGSKFFLSVHTELSMIDGTMVNLIQADSVSFCHYCKATKHEANDLTCILQGF